MTNYFNTLSLQEQLTQLGQCRLMDATEFSTGCQFLQGKTIVIVGSGAQGLNQGLCLRDSGLNVRFALRQEAIKSQNQSWHTANKNGFTIGTAAEIVPDADIILNLTPDKQHATVIKDIQPFIKPDACLVYSHGFNIVEQGQAIRPDITVIMVAPKCPGSEVRKEYLRNFGVPTLVAVHPPNDPQQHGLEIAKAIAAGIGSHRAGVLESSFVAEVKSDLMGEQTILCGMQQLGTLLFFERMVADGVPADYAAQLLQHGWATIATALKLGGITQMMDRLSNPAKIHAHHISTRLKEKMTPLYRQHMADIISGSFARELIQDWEAGDKQLQAGRAETAASAFEQTAPTDDPIPEQQYFDHGIALVGMMKAGIELAFETMVANGMKAESAYYESLHEVPLIANLISTCKLSEMNRVISDTAEYGNYLFTDNCRPLLRDELMQLDTQMVGRGLHDATNGCDNIELIRVNEHIRHHPIEIVGRQLRRYMSNMFSQ